MKDSLLILSGFIRNPKQVGAVAPSSKFLTGKIIKGMDFKTAKNIVELGPGLGTFTAAILKKAKPDAKVYCFEVNKNFCSYLEKNIIDKRLVIINAGAESISSNLKKFDVRKADYIISGLPFRNFSKAKKKEILREVRTSLSHGGKFILFQYTNGLSKMLKLYFNKVNSAFVPLNMPPSFVYVCEQ